MSSNLTGGTHQMGVSRDHPCGVLPVGGTYQMGDKGELGSPTGTSAPGPTDRARHLDCFGTIISGSIPGSNRLSSEEPSIDSTLA